MAQEDAFVLIVDDNPKDLELLGQILRFQGFKYEIAKDGVQALEITKEKKPDLVLLDIILPKMNGIEVCQNIKNNRETEDIPVIFITGLSDMWNKAKGFEAGAVDYIIKPFLKEEVVVRVNTHIKLKKTLEKLESMTMTDELTGVFNRSFAYEVLSKQIEFVKRREENLILCFIDVDDMKEINEKCGHSVGDSLLAHLAHSIGACIRKSDYIFRMGGDEFLILFLNFEMEKTDSLIGRIKPELNENSFCDITMDFSFGFVEFYHEEEISVDQLISSAYSKMKESKDRKNA